MLFFSNKVKALSVFVFFYSCNNLYLWKLLSDITTHKHSLQVDPQILYNQPVLNNLSSTG